MTWRDKVHEVVELAALESYRHMNYRDGRRLKRHVPYTLPGWADDLVKSLGQDDEEACKAIMLSYDAMKVRRGKS